MPSTARPIFIISAMGSGSTLMRLILDSHEHIGIPQETGFMRAYNAHRFVPFKHSGRNWALRMGWTRKELDHELALFYERIFTRYAEAHGKTRWGDKTPLHTWHVDAMLRLFPDAMFIAMIRHPGASVGSIMRRFGHPCRNAAGHVGRYDREIARQAAKHSERFVIVRYEELVLRPEPLLRELLDWLGEPWSDNVLAHHEVQTARAADKLIVEGTNRIDDPIDISRIDKWHRMMSTREREHVRSRLGPIAEFYGYDASDPTVLAPVSRDGSFLISGADIDARIDQFAALGLRVKGEPSLAERYYNPRRMKLRAIGAFADTLGEPTPPLMVRAWHLLPPRARTRLRPLAKLRTRAVRAQRRRRRA